MSKQISTQIVINATPEKVWNILTDFERYPAWNPFIKSIKGPAIIGQSITARIEPPEALGMTFTPNVLVFNSNQEVRWRGKFIISGLFDGEHIFQLTDNGNGTTTFQQSELFSGILVPLFKKMIDNNTMNGFQLMNQKLKELAEKK
jgi:hypothetical protein